MSKRCPKCGSTVERINRTKFTRILSKAIKVYYFRCRNPQCAWEGAIFSESSVKRFIISLVILALVIGVGTQTIPLIIDKIEQWQQSATS